MEKREISDKLTVVFRNILNNQALVLTGELTANDVDNWDSLTHMLIINEVEKEFSIRFKLKELNKMRNVGDMIDLIQSKL
jgi:acyl carrier protein